MGLLERNPLSKGYWQKVQNKINSTNNISFDQYGDYDDYSSTAALGFNVIGASGNGKSQGISRIINTYPQVIHHKNFQGENFTESQLVWLKLDCPFDGSTKGLCINLFQAIDAILNTNYQSHYVKTSSRIDELITSIQQVAANHHLGILVIDEIQRLNLSKSGGAEKMLNFFVQLVNTIGVPIVLVGTYKAKAIFTGSFSQMRRGAGQGDVIWDLMSFDDQWNIFVESMWKYEFTQYKTSANKLKRLSKVLYNETQGVIDLAVKTFAFAQEFAIETGLEKITPAIIHAVVRDRFKMLGPALEAFKKKDKEALSVFEDAYSTFVSDYLTNSTQEQISNNNSFPLQIIGKVTQEPEVKALLTDSQKNVSEFFKAAVKAKSLTEVSEIDTTNEAKSKRRQKSKKISSDNSSGTLPALFDDLQNDNKDSSYHVLKDAGFIQLDNNFVLSHDQD